ncbi:MAG: EAL domain-containing protein [Rhodocyclaceae bacterium]|nr:EAL domain-containing protein [Rhodocyclaceae bacterium]
MNSPEASVLRHLRLLLVEDTQDDALLLERTLKKGGFQPDTVRVQTAVDLEAALAADGWDLVISDYTMPEFSGLQALAITRQHDPHLPFIIVSGNIGEDVAVGAMRAGAQDYVLKSNLARLVPAIARELEEADARRRNKETEAALNQFQERLGSLLGSLGDIVWSVSLPDMHMDYLNDTAEAICGRPVSELLSNPKAWLEMVHAEDRERMRRYIDETAAKGSNSAEYRILRPDGEIRWLFDRARVIVGDNGEPLRIDGITTDVTHYQQQQDLLYKVAHHDALTGLPNRGLMQDRLRQALHQHEKVNEALAVLIIDVDRFKTINDSLGHKIGDQVLLEVGHRLRQALRIEDTVARLGGDEFVVLLPNVAQEDHVAVVARKLVQAIAPTIEIEGHRIHCSASLGISLFPRDGDSVEALLKNADVAMYEAKRAGRDTFRFYAAAMNAGANRNLKLENALHDALARNELDLHYQPQIDLSRNGAICGFEALLRWNHAELGFVSPAEFIPIAEETGLIVPIGEWVLARACRQAKQWVETFDTNLRVAVNLSARQFSLPNLPQVVAAALKETGLPARNLELEVTESLIMQDVEQSAHTLRELKAMGITLAVDDFGTGYSSLAYLKRFPLDILKIDKSFVAEITSNPDDAAICSSIIALAHSLRKKVVAEGVENEAQLGFLAQQHCDRAQGFHFSRPVVAAAAGELLHNGLSLGPLPTQASARTRTLLLLDDEANILTSLKRLLRREGYNILIANNSTEAFELLSANPVGVVISDQRMPDMTGTEFLKRVKEFYPDTTRMVLSGYTDLQSVIEAINEGSIYRFLTKPWDDDQLRAVIRDAFQQQEMAQENALLNQQNRENTARLQEMNERLESLLSQKSDRIARDEALIGAAQEAFYQVPVPLVGIDDDGMVVLANSRALELWPEALPGSDLVEALPAELAARLLSVAAAESLPLEIGGRRYLGQRQRIDSRSGGTGWLLTFLPLSLAATGSPSETAPGAVPPRIH